MEFLGRSLAPISSAALGQIDEQAVATLRGNLSARKFVDVKGPQGWEVAGVAVGRFGKLEKDGKVGFGVRQSVPFVESRVEFVLDALEMHNVDRGCADPDLTAVEEAAKAAAAFEDKIVYKGLKKAGVLGMADVAENKPVELKKADPEAFMRAILDETTRLNTVESIGGPFALVGGSEMRDALAKLITNRSLYEVIEKNTEVEEFIYAPTLDGAYLVSTRGGDLELTLGGDFAIGYHYRDVDKLTFYITESFTFRILEPRAFTTLVLK